MEPHVHIAPDQVAGHGKMLCPDDEEDGISKILKPVCPDSELEFYRTLVEDGGEDAMRLTPFTPRFFGTVVVEGQEYMSMENLMRGMEEVCIIDLKVGVRQYTPLMTEQKIKACIAKSRNSTSGSHGIRICGMKVIDHDTGNVLKLSKMDTQRDNYEKFRANIVRFLSRETGQVLKELVQSYYDRVGALIDVFERQETYRFYSSSILLVYDAKHPERNDLRMIDFAHSFRLSTGANMVATEDDGFEDNGTSGIDVGVLKGLRTLHNILEELLRC